MSQREQLVNGPAVGVVVEQVHGELKDPFAGEFSVAVTEAIATRLLEASGASTITDAIRDALDRAAERAHVCNRELGGTDAEKSGAAYALRISGLERRIVELEKKLRAAHWFNERAAREIESARLPEALRRLQGAYVHAEGLSDGASAYMITTTAGECASSEEREEIVQALADLLEADVAPDGWPDEPPAERLEELVHGLVGVDITLLKRGRPELADRAEELVKGLGALLRDVLDVPARTATAV